MVQNFQSIVTRFLASDRSIFLLFLLCSFLLYGSTLFGEFVYDDAFFITMGAMRSWSYLWNVWFDPSLLSLQSNSIYRPFTFFSYALNFLLFGESPVSFHIVSILVHGSTSWLVFLVTRRLFRQVNLAWCTALFFLILPIHVESIAYIKARDDLFVGFFGVLSWYAFLRATEKPILQYRWVVASCIAVLLAFFSKETALVFPGVFGFTCLIQRGWRDVRRAWLPFFLFLCAIAIFMTFRLIALGGGSFPDGEILYFGQNPLGYMTYAFVPWTACILFFIAVSMTFVPWNLSATYGYAHVPLVSSLLGSWMVLAGMCSLIILLTFLMIPKLRRSPLGIGALTFLILYFPFSKVPFYKSIDLFAERWLYAPSIGLSMIGGYVLWLIWKRVPSIAPILFTAIAVGYLFVLIPRNQVWMNETRLGESMVKSAPRSVISYVFLGNNRLQYGRLNESADLVTKGLHISRDHIPIHHIAAAVSMGMGRLDIADQAVSAAETLGGDELANVILRSTLLAKQHRFQESLDHLKSSQWFDPTEHRTRMLLALNLWMLDKKEMALEYFDWDKYLPGMKMSIEEKVIMFQQY